MTVRVDDPRHNEPARRINHQHPRLGHQIGADRRDRPVLHEDRVTNQRFPRRGQHRRPLHENAPSRLNRPRPAVLGKLDRLLDNRRLPRSRLAPRDARRRSIHGLSRIRHVGRVACDGRFLSRSDRATRSRGTWRLRFLHAFDGGQLDRRITFWRGFDSLRTPLRRRTERRLQVATQLRRVGCAHRFRCRIRLRFVRRCGGRCPPYGVELQLDRVVPRSDGDDELNPILRRLARGEPSITLIALEVARQRAVALIQFQLATQLAVGRIDFDRPLPRDLQRLRFAGLRRFNRLRVLVVFVPLTIDDDMPHFRMFVVERSRHRDEVRGFADLNRAEFPFQSEHHRRLSRQRGECRIAVEAIRNRLPHSLEYVGLRLRLARRDREPHPRFVQRGQPRDSLLPILPLVFANALRLGKVGEQIIFVRLGGFELRLIVEINLHDHVGLSLLEPLDHAISFASAPNDGTKLMLGREVQRAIVIVARVSDKNRLRPRSPHRVECLERGINRRPLDTRRSSRKQLLPLCVTLGIEERLPQMCVNSHQSRRVVLATSFGKLHRRERRCRKQSLTHRQRRQIHHGSRPTRDPPRRQHVHGDKPRLTVLVEISLLRLEMLSRSKLGRQTIPIIASHPGQSVLRDIHAPPFERHRLHFVKQSRSPRINEARIEVQPVSLDHQRIGRNRGVRSDGDDSSVTNNHAPFVDDLP